MFCGCRIGFLSREAVKIANLFSSLPKPDEGRSTAGAHPIPSIASDAPHLPPG